MNLHLYLILKFPWYRLFHFLSGFLFFTVYTNAGGLYLPVLNPVMVPVLKH